MYLNGRNSCKAKKEMNKILKKDLVELLNEYVELIVSFFDINKILEIKEIILTWKPSEKNISVLQIITSGNTPIGNIIEVIKWKITTSA